ncbi:MAG: carbamoyl phosphate synthase small subunit, partial [Alphaproteobacteria bacterium]|nr:carbamoyl phosphate synthase small subunit [Alphaproteobacteria bacterium]
YIRTNGMFDAVLAHDKNGIFDDNLMRNTLDAFTGLDGQDLASRVSTGEHYEWQQGRWSQTQNDFTKPTTQFHVVALDFGVKKNILRCLASAGCKITILPASASADDILSHNPDGLFLSNGPGDPAATSYQAPHILPTLQKLIATNLPIFGICLGHQILAQALGAKTEKMPQGHHGANHPVKDMTTGKVEIVSMNHGFTLARDSLPAHIEETHISLFDGTNCGLAVKDKPIFSVQYHPEASPGPQDSHYLFDRFVEMMRH